MSVNVLEHWLLTVPRYDFWPYLGVGEEEEHEHNRIPEKQLGLAQHERVHFQSPFNVIYEISADQAEEEEEPRFRDPSFLNISGNVYIKLVQIPN